MSYYSRHIRFSAMHVATNGDVARDGGYLEFRNGEKFLFPNLHMHVRFGNIDGAVWANQELTQFVVVKTNTRNSKLEKVTEMDAKELAAFKNRDGIFHVLV